MGGGNRFLDRVFKVEAFKKALPRAVEEFNRDLPARAVQAAGGRTGRRDLRPAVQEESDDKLVRFDKVVAGQPASAVPPAAPA